MAALDVTSWVSVTSVLTACVVTLLTVWIWREVQKVRIFKRLGIPGPPAWPFLLDTPQMMMHGFATTLQEWGKQYPKMYGCFVMRQPAVVVSDLELLRDVMVKKFALFSNRMHDPSFEQKPLTENLLSLRDDHWKHVRSRLSPAFSSGKLKKMAVAIERVARNLHKYIQEQASTGKEVELKALCRNYAVDNIAGVAFGLQVDSLKDPDDIFLKHSNALANLNGLLATIVFTLPFLVPLLGKLGITFPPQASSKFFLGILDSSLQERRHDNQKNHADFLQLLVEAEKEGAADQGHVDAEIDHGQHLRTSAQWSNKGLTKEEIYANTLVFLLAGNDTVSTVLSFTLFCLATHPECLAKAQAEVDEKLGKKPVNYDTANDLTYIDMCMNETVRLFSPAFFLDREVSQDMELGGYHVPKGMAIIIPAFSIHRDPAIWPDPMHFDPERHTPEGRASRHAFSFMPFGLGPRNCIGMRLAQLEVRMALATVLQHFTPRPCAKTVFPPKLKKITVDAEDGLWVTFQERA